MLLQTLLRTCYIRVMKKITKTFCITNYMPELIVGRDLRYVNPHYDGLTHNFPAVILKRNRILLQTDFPERGATRESKNNNRTSCNNRSLVLSTWFLARRSANMAHTRTCHKGYFPLLTFRNRICRVLLRSPECLFNLSAWFSFVNFSLRCVATFLFLGGW